jgi:hypothetical protein
VPAKARLFERGSQYQLGQGGNLVDLAYSGGTRGMELTRRMLVQGLERLAPEGRLYLFLI